MEPFRHHVFVCTQQKPEGVTCCPAGGSTSILGALHGELGKQGLSNDVQVTPADVPEIVSSHLRADNVVSRLERNDPPAMKAAAVDHTQKYLAMVKAKDEAGVLPDDLYELTRAYMPSRVLLTALELDVFTAVADGASAEAVAQKIGAAPRSTEMLLNALASLKLLEKRDGTFFNSAASARFFAEGSSDNARGGLLHIANIWHRWSTLTDSVCAGTSVAPRVRNGN